MLRVAIAIIGVSMAFAGCGASTPGCGSPETLDLVRQIIQRDLDMSPGEFSIDLVVTDAYDEKLDAYTCSAQLEAGQESVPITFTARRSATDSQSFVVNVYAD